MRARKLVLRGSPRFSPTELEQEAKAANVSGVDILVVRDFLSRE